MKNVIKIFLLISVLISCTKEPLYEPYPPTYDYVCDTVICVDPNFIDGDWELVSGTMYLENLETGETYEEFLFNGTNVSSLRYSGSMYDFEDIVRYQTTWSFYFPQNIPGTGTFMINGDSIYSYGLSVTNTNLTVIEPLTGGYLLLGGSSRPIQYEILDVENGIINIYVQETYENIDGYNYRYYSKLRFKTTTL